MEEPRFDPLDYVSAFNRRKWWFIVPVVLAILIGSLLAWKLPRLYQSTAVVAISSPRVTPNLVSGAADVDKSERVRALSQQLLSRPVLERVVREEHLDGKASTDSAVNGLRRSISVAMSAGLTPGSTANLSPEAKAQLDSYQLIYTDDTAESAQRVLNRLANVFVDENNKTRASRAEDTTAFIGMQLETTQMRLSDVEARLRTAKESYMGRLPEQTNANLQMVAALQRQLESNATAMRGEQDRLSLIERQLQSIEQGLDVGPVGGAAPALSAQARVVQLRNELAAAQLNYTNRHPEIIRLKDELATAEQAAAAERSRPLSDRMTVLQSNPDTSSSPRTARRPRCGWRSCSASRRAPATRSAAIRAGSKPRRGSSRSSLRCSASTTSNGRRTATWLRRSRPPPSRKTCRCARVASSSRCWSRPAFRPSRSSRTRCA